MTSGAAGAADAGYAVEVTSKSGNKFKITKTAVAGGSAVDRTCTAVRQVRLPDQPQVVVD